MRELTIEQKAKAYDEALKQIKECTPDENGFITIYPNDIFPEFKESEDEKIRKELIEHINLFKTTVISDFKERQYDSWIAWLEKQGKKELENYDEAEKEKADFVGDGFIECHADFLDFKEGETYWLEYIGDDKYNVRSDNLLGKTYHITPCQLYTVFKKLTWLEKQGQTFTKKDVDDAYLKGVTDAKNELEKQYEANYQLRKDIATFIFNYRGDIKDRAKWMDYLGIKISFGEKQGEQKSTDKAEPKFKVGDWIVFNGLSLLIKEVVQGYYRTISVDGISTIYDWDIDNVARLWTISEAKDGDVLVNGSNIFIFHFINDTRLMGYCHVNTDDGRFYDDMGKNECFCLIDAVVNPATAEQCDLLFSKMHESVYEFNFEKKELKRIEPKFKVGDWIVTPKNKVIQITSIEGTRYCFNNTSHYWEIYYCDQECHLWTISDARDGDVLACNEEILLFKSYSVQGRISVYCWYNGHTNDFFSKEVVDASITTRNKIWPATKEQRELLFQKMKEAGYEWDEEKKKLKRIEEKPTWSEEDERIRQRFINSIQDYEGL